MHNVIIDGYNVIHADDDLKRTVKRDLQRARSDLIGRITRYLEKRKLRITLVFDGHGGITDVDIPVPGRLQVMFSCSGQTADELILETLRSSTNARAFTVVTSDMADIGKEARALGADVVSSADFLQRMQGKVRPPLRESDKKDSVGDVDYWLEQFRNGEEDDGTETP
jgi:predicted RNA-binding protein with PIN domain